MIVHVLQKYCIYYSDFFSLLYDLFNLRTVLVSLNLTVACMCYNLYLLTGQYMFVIFG